jgi:uncharacterized membrane protein YdjX (TVP38/TMEM64 family)
VPREKVEEAMAETGSLLKTIEAMRGGHKALAPLKSSPREKNFLADPSIADPERPINAVSFVDRFVGRDNGHSGRRRILAFAGLVLLLVVLALLWRWTPLSVYLDVTSLMGSIQGIRSHPLTPLAVIGLFVAGGLIVFPVLGLIAATSLIFDPLPAFCLAMTGSLLSAAAMYGVGHALGRNLVRHVAGRRVNQLSRNLARRGLVTIVVLRIVPVAPYSIVNLLAGASHIVFRDFIIGTLIGMLPGIFALTLFTESLKHFITEPSLFNIAVLAGAMIMAVALLAWVSKITRRAAGETPEERGP